MQKIKTEKNPYIYIYTLMKNIGFNLKKSDVKEKRCKGGTGTWGGGGVLGGAVLQTHTH